MERPPGGNVNRGPGFLACGIVTTIGALIAVCLRMYVRTQIVHAVGWDDWMSVFAMVTYHLNLYCICVDDSARSRLY